MIKFTSKNDAHPFRWLAVLVRLMASEAAAEPISYGSVDVWQVIVDKNAVVINLLSKVD